MPTDIDIAQACQPKPILDLAQGRLNLPPEALEPYGRFKAKISLDHLATLPERPDARLILVTAISPTPAGEGKTTTSVGLNDGLNRIGKNSIVCLREPSLGPCFGMKGGAAGGGHAQIVPMEDINLHFTGDFHAIGLANNLLAALIDNHIHHGNQLDLDPRRITWKRVVDMNDRALRDIVVALGGKPNGFPREDGFDITVASEIMAIFCLASSVQELKTRLGNIRIGYTRGGDPVHARDLNAAGAMAVLLKDALHPNLVQSLEGNPALVHGGPFANIAHGCNSVLATKAGLKLADYVVTEAGFGADLGAEKFVDIKCRKSGLRPSAIVLVATIRALKFHGGVALDDLKQPDPEAVRRGMVNLERHLDNIQNVWGMPCVVAINHFVADTDAEVEVVVSTLAERGVSAVPARHWADGGAGAEDLARAVSAAVDNASAELQFTYPDDMPLWDKMQAVAQRIYRADKVTASAAVRRQLKNYERDGLGHYPVCVAKTQYSFSADPKALGAPEGHEIEVREVRLSAGAEFLVMICGGIMTMPGLPKTPAAHAIDLDDDGRIVGLF